MILNKFHRVYNKHWTGSIKWWLTYLRLNIEQADTHEHAYTNTLSQ